MPSRPLNPFAALTRDIAEKVLSDVRAKAKAERRMAALLSAYTDLMQDPRHKAIRAELALMLGDYLRDLVAAARHCARCAPKAEPIRFLQEVVAEPLEEIWFARSKEDEKPTEDAVVDEDA